jgi:hypothetical protein
MDSLSRPVVIALPLRIFAILCTTCAILANVYAIDSDSLVKVVTTVREESTTAVVSQTSKVEQERFKENLCWRDQLLKAVDRVEMVYRSSLEVTL